MMNQSNPQADNRMCVAEKAMEWVLYLLIFSLPISTAAVSVTTVLLLGYGLLRPCVSWGHPLIRAMAVLLTWHLVGLCYSQAPWPDIGARLLDGIRFVLPFVLLPFFARPMVFKRSLLVYIAGVGSMLFFVALKYYGHYAIGPEHFHVTTVFKDRITTGFLVAIAAFVTAHYLKAEYQHLSWKMRYGLGLFFLIMLYYLFFLNTGRSGYGLAFFLLLLSGWQWGRWRGLIGMVILLSGLFLGNLWIKTPTSDRFMEVRSDSFKEERFEFYKNSREIILARLISGYGLGSFKSEYESMCRKREHCHRVLSDADSDTMICAPLCGRSVNNPHNQYILHLVEGGLIGCTLLLAVSVYLFRSLSGVPVFQRQIGQGVLGCFLIGFFFNSWWMDVTEGTLLSIFLCMVLGMYDRKRCHE